MGKPVHINNSVGKLNMHADTDKDQNRRELDLVTILTLLTAYIHFNFCLNQCFGLGDFTLRIYVPL